MTGVGSGGKGERRRALLLKHLQTPFNSFRYGRVAGVSLGAHVSFYFTVRIVIGSLTHLIGRRYRFLASTCP